jgi:DNA-binding MarR family transcriptional regulator
LARLVSAMGRLLNGLAALAAFREAKFGLSEWVALITLAEEPAINNRQLARTLGFTRQRANQVIRSLEQARLISVTQSPQDARQNVIMVSSLGKARLERVNAQILAALGAPMHGKAQMLNRCNTMIRMLIRMVRSDRESRVPKKVMRLSRRRAVQDSRRKRLEKQAKHD